MTGKVDLNDCFIMRLPLLVTCLGMTASLQLAAPLSLQAQSEGWLLGPNSRTGENSKVVPSNCIEEADGSITCDTKLANPSGDTPARPSYNPFNN